MWLPRAGLAGVLACSLFLGFSACSSGGTHPPAAMGDTNPKQMQAPEAGTPCPVEGAVRECGHITHTYGDYVTCSVGHATCQGGVWGECIGDHFTTMSMPNVRLTGSGIHVMSTPIPCTNICDPWCQSVHDSGDAGVDASDFIPNPDGGGLTLEKSDAGVVVKASAKCRDLQCNLVTCAGKGVTTTLSGTVYDPAGNNPMYNANVYIPLVAGAALPAFGTGASCDTCSGAAALDAIRSTQTDADGNFTLSDVPAGANIPVVVQMGKWRREIVLKSVTSCGSNTVTGNCTAPNAADCVFRLPKNHADGVDPVTGTYTKADVPKIAIVSGSADPFDCLLLKAGLDPAEFGDSTSTKRFHYYQSDNSPGDKLSLSYGADVAGSTLWNNLNGAGSNLMSYDVVLLPCEGGAIDKQTGANTPYQNLISYVNAGGRAFATHYSYVWLQYPAALGYVAAPDNWSTVAKWTHKTGTTNTQDPMTGVVDTSFPKGGVYSTWLQNVAASATASKVTIHEGRQDLTTLGTGAQSWMSAHDTNYASAPDYSALFTFNTPYAAAPANQCGRVVYSDFHVSANALVGANQCLTAQDCGYTASCTGAKVGTVGQCSEPCDTSSDCPATSYTCNGAAIGNCVLNSCASNSDCPSGETCNAGKCSCSAGTAGAECGSGVCSSMTCKAGHSCTSNANCGLGTCGGGTCTKSGTNAAGACHKNTDCGLGTCGGGANNGTCAAGAACHVNADCGVAGTCGTGTSATVGNCSTNAVACHSAGACDSGSCTGGTCSTSSAACHSNANCDGGAACGTGTGATLGACSTSGAVCHATGACDGGSCSGGSCSTSGIACHTALACDSGSCAGGTCATGAATSCHSAAACDSGTCAGGTCGTGAATTCHKALDCDSGICGAVKGVCTRTCAGGTNIGKTCTANSNCPGSSCSSASACSVDGDCTSSGAVCTGVKCSAKSCGDDLTCGVSHSCTAATCAAKSCGDDLSCGASHLCNAATCAAKSCGDDLSCGVSHSCNGAKCPVSTCASDAACTTTHLCNGATCATAACTGDSSCGVSNLCNGAKCTSVTCAGDTACSSSHVCTGAKCSSSTCANDTQCATGTLCANAKCTSVTCGSKADCGTSSSDVCSLATCTTNACNANADCGSGGTCNGGTCKADTCTATNACGSEETCTGYTQGSCQKACTTNADCAPDLCVAGKCGGCTNSAQCNDNAYSASCGGIPAANYGKCSVYTSGQFPAACRQGQLSPQEKALEFMFFDLTACVSPDDLTPAQPAVVPGYNPATFVQDYTANCGAGTKPVWREFDWQASIPNTASISIQAQSGDTVATLAPAMPLTVVDATTSTNVGPTGTSFDYALIDAGQGTTPSGAFNTASPIVPSRNLLRLTVTLTPTSDNLAAPTLLQWKVQYDCKPAE